MSGLNFEQAPAPSHPLRFLLSALAWGAIAGIWVAWSGPEILVSRWAPATIVLVHLLTLGVLGNAMVGSLIQFLPVAAGSPLPGSRYAPVVHLALNCGIACLLSAIGFHASVLAGVAVFLLAGTLAAFAVAALIGLLRGSGRTPPRMGIGMALAAILTNVVLGIAMLGIRVGWWGSPAHSLVDLHAALGIVGWVIGLIGAVGGITLPMLQGTRAIPRPAAIVWLTVLALTLLTAIGSSIGLFPDGARTVLALPVALLSGAVLFLQWKSPHRRNPTLRRFWAVGSACLLAAVSVAVASPGPWPFDRPILVGALLLGAGLPFLVLGMTLEIMGFLTWIEMRRRVPRGTRIPGVGSLLPEPGKKRLLVSHCLAATTLIVSVAYPPLARIAGLFVALAYVATFRSAWSGWRDGIAFAASHRPAST
ncbi:hypothetical protein CSC71_10735 [Pseudoxanthomonas sangjuensis]|uniref:hypothetical protein n=1 Tax=Pseudoxanthomonas sangjuensis TaxID=1503750 RepID=UPI001390BAB4|nr:hypothetical protein [Pseudoxanthomonas sangjuensis]KAF1709710.1 hypothetical protein CSC71_10735 [Pseudoxanthomonas sangjuensis]